MDNAPENSNREIIFSRRPALRSFFVFFFGIAILLIGPILSNGQTLSPTARMVIVAIFLIIIFRRWSSIYILTPSTFTIESGMLARETTVMPIADIYDIEVNQGLTLRMMGVGHLLIRSRNPNQASIIMYGQPSPFRLREMMLELAGVNQDPEDGDIEIEQ